MANPKQRVIRTSQGSKASVLVQDNSVSVIGDSRHLIVVDDRGVTIKGPLSIVSDAMGRRSGGLFVEISDFQQMIPQTIVTPFPSKMPFPPIAGLINMVQDVAFFLALLV